MDDIDRIIKEIVERFFREGHIKISARTIARRGNIPVKVVSGHIAKHDLNLSWEKRDRGIIILKNGMHQR